MIGAAYSVPASLFRVYGGVCPTNTARAASCTGRSAGLGRLHLPPVLSADRVRRAGHSRADELPRWRPASSAFTVIVFVLGFFMSLGKAAVYKHIPVYYPQHVGSVGGVVGLVGGLGGFVLPIRSACSTISPACGRAASWLLFALSARRLVWMHLADPRHGEGRLRRGAREAARTSRDAGDPRPEQSARSARHAIEDWRPEDKDFWAADGPGDRAPQLLISIPCAAAVVRRVDGVVGGGREAAGHRLHLHDRPAVLAGRVARAVGRDAAHLLLVHGADLRRAAVDDADHLVADHARRSASAWRCRTRPRPTGCSWRWRCCAASAAATSPRRWPNISFFFPKAEKGNALALNAGLGNLGVSVVQFVVPLVITAGVFGWLGGEPTWQHAAAASLPLWLQNAGFIWVPFIVASAFAAWFGMDDIASMPRPRSPSRR